LFVLGILAAVLVGVFGGGVKRKVAAPAAQAAALEPAEVPAAAVSSDDGHLSSRAKQPVR
jgi:hypothetical protein